MTFTFEPIAHVISPRVQAVEDGWDNVVAKITLDSRRFTPDSLYGVHEFSHLEVVYLFDRVQLDGRELHPRHPRGNPSWPKVGVFAQRGPVRPNRIGVSVCRLLTVEGLTLTVQGLDAIDASPVLDIKPYIAEFAPRGPIQQPAWAKELMMHYWQRSSSGVSQATVTQADPEVPEGST